MVLDLVPVLVLALALVVALFPVLVLALFLVLACQEFNVAAKTT